MKVLYLLNGSALYGGVKVVYQQARALRRLGVEAEVACPEPPSPWFPGIEEFYRQVPSFEPHHLGPADLAVATMWWTAPLALRVPGAVAAHLCQCYEGLYEGVRESWPEIESAYRLPTLKLAVSPHLVSLIEERFAQEAAWIPQPFEPERFHPPRVERSGECPGQEPADGKLRLLVAGHWDLPIKGVAWGMRALRPLAEEGWLELVRLSLDAPAEEMACWPEAERHLHVDPERVPEILRGVDAYAGLSTEVEGFGLPGLEAMGCGRPSVLTAIGASKSLDPDGRASLQVPVGDDEALRTAVRGLRDSGLRRRLGRAGREIARGFSEERTARALHEAFEAALGERASTEPLAARF